MTLNALLFELFEWSFTVLSIGIFFDPPFCCCSVVAGFVWPNTENGFLLKAGEYFGKLFDSADCFQGGVDKVFEAGVGVATEEDVSLSGITNPFILVKVVFLLESLPVLVISLFPCPPERRKK